MPLLVSSDRKGRAVAETCKHCGKRIVRSNDWANRQTWTHQVEGAAFQDGQHTYCHRTTAEPEGQVER